MMFTKTNGSLAPRRWRRDQAAELELLAILDAHDRGDRESVPHVPRGTFPAVETASPDLEPFGRAVFPMELLNR